MLLAGVPLYPPLFVVGGYFALHSYAAPFLRWVTGSVAAPLAKTSPLASPAPLDPWVAFVLLGVAPMVAFYTFSFLLFLLDVLPFASLERWRSQARLQGRIRVRFGDYLSALPLTLLNWTLVGLPFAALLCWVVLPWRAAWNPAESGSSPMTSLYGIPLPDARTYARDFLLTLVAEEVLFFTSHYLLHAVPALYRAVHKVHHTYTSPFGVAAVYAHPFEHLVSNVIPVAMGPFLAGSHPLFGMLWSVLAVTVTASAHSGYVLPLMEPPFFHDWHHEVFNECYGVLRVMDYLCVTDVGYRKAEREGLLAVPRGKKKGAGEKEKDGKAEEEKKGK